MDNPDDEKTTVNVKGVSAKAWERAKKAATRQDETMGSWLSRAANQLADREAAPRELPPAPVANPDPQNSKAVPVAGIVDALSALGGLMAGQAAMVGATGIKPPKTETRRLNRLADTMARAALGEPPRPPSRPRLPRQTALTGPD